MKRGTRDFLALLVIAPVLAVIWFYVVFTPPRKTKIKTVRLAKYELTLYYVEPRAFTPTVFSSKDIYAKSIHLGNFSEQKVYSTEVTIFDSIQIIGRTDEIVEINPFRKSEIEERFACVIDFENFKSPCVFKR